MINTYKGKLTGSKTEQTQWVNNFSVVRTSRELKRLLREQLEVTEITIPLIREMQTELVLPMNSKVAIITADNLIYLGKGSLGANNSLVRVNAKKLETLSENCFYGAKKLNYVDTINVITIGSTVFSHTKMKIGDFPKALNVGWGAFSKAKFTKINLNSIIDLSQAAFTNCPNIVELNMENVKTITGWGVLQGMPKLKKLTLMKLETLKSDTSIEELIAPNLKSIGSYPSKLKNFNGITTKTGIREALKKLR